MGRRLAIFAVTILILIGRGNVADAAPSVHLSFLPPQPVKVTEAAAAAASPLPVGRLADANVPMHYRFTLTPPSKTAVDVRKGPDGSWLVVMAPSHRPVFVLAAPLVQDSPRDPKAVPAPERRASLSVSRQGSSFSIDLTVDSAWLHDSRRHFPVLVDPTLTVQPDTQDADFTWNQPT